MYDAACWEMTKKRFEAFWDKEIVDRCCIGIFAPDPQGSEDGFIEAEDLEAKWTDLPYRMRELDAHLEPGQMVRASVRHIGHDFTHAVRTVRQAGACSPG